LPASPVGVDDRAVSVTGLGAWCDFVTEDEYRQRLVRDGWPADEIEHLVEESNLGVSFDVHEFAELTDGRRLTLHEERGFTTSGQWRHLTLENLERDVRTTVLPDDDDTQDEHPWGVARRAPARLRRPGDSRGTPASSL
jgi:hypothetical protein